MQVSRPVPLAPREAFVLRPFRIVGAVTPFHRMRLVATLLLLAMALAWATNLWLLPRYPEHVRELAYARAFFEAAMVGGLADWFAVTALFRRPLGLPIPHTAIIPSNKDRIGDSLAQFLKENFLTPAVMARRLEGFDLAGGLGRWLVAPPTRAGVKAGRLRRALSKLLLQFVDALDDEVIAKLIGVTVTDRLRDRALAPVLGRLIRPLIDAGRHEALVEALLRAAMTAVDARQAEIHAAVAVRAPKYMPGFVDRGYAQAFIDAIQDHLYAMTQEAAEAQRRDAALVVQGFRERLAAHEGHGTPLPPPSPVLPMGEDHPDRQAITRRLRAFADDLLEPRSAAAQAVEDIKREIFDAPATAAVFASLWTTIKAMLADMANAPPGSGTGRVAVAAGNVILGNAALADAINTLARRAAVSVVATYGDGIVRLVSDTIRGWDAATVTDKLEAAVGRDLQYIRINGTVIGGLVGVAIHAAGLAV